MTLTFNLIQLNGHPYNKIEMILKICFRYPLVRSLKMSAYNSCSIHLTLIFKVMNAHLIN